MNNTIVTQAQPYVQTKQQAWTETVQALGSLDALDGYPFCPEAYVTRHCDKVAYAQGYEAIAGPTPSSDLIMGRTEWRELYADDEDYIENDYEWLIQGGS
jgi:hypothetical protein